MNYQNELNFLLSFFKNYHLNANIYAIEQITASLVLPLHQKFNPQENRDAIQNFFMNKVQPNCIYRITDQFFCIYYVLQLPEYLPASVLLIGPYTAQIPHQLLSETMEKHNIPPQSFSTIQKFLSALPTIRDDTFIQTILQTFCEKIWEQPNAYTFKELDYSMREITSIPSWPTDITSQEYSVFDITLVENYSARENDLILAVSQGLTQKADTILTNLTSSHLEQIAEDSLPYLKLQTISINTLLRKACEANTVNYYQLTKISASYTEKLALVTSPESCIKLQHEMVRKYCLAVQSYSLKDYSSLIRDIIKRINSDPTADLSLKALADKLNVNPSYLSALFKKETGMTLTDYVNKKRVNHAIFLLNTTNLQIQTIAQYCGINDANYFTKLFQKHTNLSPTDYRKQIQHNTAKELPH